MNAPGNESKSVHCVVTHALLILLSRLADKCQIITIVVLIIVLIIVIIFFFIPF